MGRRESLGPLEVNTIQPIPADQRHGTARDLFTVWFGSNLMLLTVITGGLGVTVYRLSFAWTLIAMVLGNAIGAIFMALHAAQGPRLGVPQMVQTRGQFGSLGSLLVVGIVIVMYIGFISSNLVLTGEAIESLWPRFGEAPGIVLVGVLSVLASIWGYDMIHAYLRVMSYVSGVVLLLAFGWIFFVHGLPADFLTRQGFRLTGFLSMVSVGALWQIAYAPYVSDYTRYMPADTGSRPAFWASYWGCVLGSLLPMILGAVVGLAMPAGSGMVAGLAQLTGSIAPLVLTVLSVGIAAATALNLYCSALSTISFGQTLKPDWSAGPAARAVISVVAFSLALVGALLSTGSFLASYEHFIGALLYVLVPWTAINLVDYYLLRRGQYDVASFFRADGGVYGRVNKAAVGCYLFGILVQIPFIASSLYTGPVARAVGGIDLSWIVGLLLTAPVYGFVARRFQADPAARNVQFSAAEGQS